MLCCLICLSLTSELVLSSNQKPDQIKYNQFSMINSSNSDINVESNDPSVFISKWDTTKNSTGSSTTNQIKLPLESSGVYDFNVQWGDGSSDVITVWNQTEVTHTYSSSGLYQVNITGTVVGWQFNNNGDRLKIIEIDQWGGLNLGNDGNYFYGASNLKLAANDSLDLTGTTILYRAFANCYNLGSSGNMNGWDTSEVTSMSLMFSQATNFNQPVGNWDVSSVKYMSYMFSSTSFNQPIDNWNVSSVTDMDYMFYDSSFNQPLGSWDVSGVSDMSYMFYGSSINQPLGSWDISTADLIDHMLDGVTMSVQNYDDILIGWARLPILPYSVIMGVINSHYSEAAAGYRQYLFDNYGWGIIDAGLAYLPQIQNQGDTTYQVGTTGHNMVWSVYPFGTSSLSYNVTLDGTLYVAETAWSSGLITINIDGLPEGSHIFTMYLYDNSGLVVSDLVKVNVVSLNTVTTTQITTQTPTTSIISTTTTTQTQSEVSTVTNTKTQNADSPTITTTKTKKSPFLDIQIGLLSVLLLSWITRKVKKYRS